MLVKRRGTHECVPYASLFCQFISKTISFSENHMLFEKAKKADNDNENDNDNDNVNDNDNIDISSFSSKTVCENIEI